MFSVFIPLLVTAHLSVANFAVHQVRMYVVSQYLITIAMSHVPGITPRTVKPKKPRISPKPLPIL